MEWHDSSCTRLDLANFGDGVSCLRCGSFGPPLEPPVRSPICQKSDIRILSLLPAASYHDPICCVVTTASLSSQPEYEAISYTWALESGDATESETITVGGGAFKVTKNCDTVLRRVRRQYSPRQIWIDAICIDQENIEERGHQVGLMPRIYSGARTVLIYAGERDKTANNNNNNKMVSLSLIADRDLAHRFSFDGFFGARRYFTRLWTLQEVALARRATLICGEESLPWEVFRAEASRHMEAKTLPPALHFDYDMYSNPNNLLGLLSLARGCAATDPRDKVFAILGLMPSGRIGDLGADYSLSVEDVYTRVALHLAKIYGWGQVLYNVSRGGNRRSPLRLPSWVPDWSVELDKINSHVDLNVMSLKAAAYMGTAFVDWKYDETQNSVRAKLLRMRSQGTRWIVWVEPLARICFEYFFIPRGYEFLRLLKECFDDFSESHGSSRLWGEKGAMPFGSFTPQVLDLWFQDMQEDGTCRLDGLEDCRVDKTGFDCFSTNAMLHILSGQGWRRLQRIFESTSIYLASLPVHLSGLGLTPALVDTGLPGWTTLNRLARVPSDNLEYEPEPGWRELFDATLVQFPVVDGDLEDLWMKKYDAGDLSIHQATMAMFHSEDSDRDTETNPGRVEACDKFWRILVRVFSIREAHINVQ